MKRGFGNHTSEIVQDEGVRTIIQVMQYLEQRGHDAVTMVAGSDRVRDCSDVVAPLVD